MTLWVIRAGKKGEQEHDAIEYNVCTIGWNKLPDLSNITTIDELEKIFFQHYENKNERSTRHKLYQIFKFINTIKKGDMVALPLKSQPFVAFGKIKGGYVYKKISSVINHSRSVQWMGYVHRLNLDDDIKNSLGAFMTVGKVRIDDAEKRITKILQTQKDPLDTSSLDHKSTMKVDKILQTQKDPSLDTSRLDPESIARDNIMDVIEHHFKGHVFTDLIDSILMAKGFTTKVLPPGPDHGVDILANNGSLGFGDMSICVQVKSSKSPVSESVVRDLRGVCENFNAKYGLLVAWGGLTGPAEKEIERSFFKMQFWNHEKILDEIFENYDKLDDVTKSMLPLKPTMVLSEDDEYFSDSA